MTKSEVLKFLSKVKGCYPSQFFLEEDVKREWVERLTPYDLEDVERKFEEHLKGEMSDRPPLVHFITKYLITPEEKRKYDGEYTVSCNLCGKWMPLSIYDKHYDKCLTIEYLVGIAKRKGEIITREDLEQYDLKTIDRLYEKYKPLENDLNNFANTFKG